MGLLFILSIQAPFVYFKLTTSDQHAIEALVEIAHVLFTSGLAAYLFSKTFESLLEKSLYGGLRRDWKEVRVMYSDGLGKGMGNEYPREPTLLIQTPPLMDPGLERHDQRRGDSLIAQGADGKRHVFTARSCTAPCQSSFNNAFVGKPAPGEDTFVTGKWSELQLMQVGTQGHKVTWVGFPDPLMTTGAPPPDRRTRNSGWLCRLLGHHRH